MEISGVDTVSKILDAGLDYFLEYRDYFGYSYLHNIAYYGRHELADGFDPKGEGIYLRKYTSQIFT